MPSSFVTTVSAPICAGDVAVTVTPGNAPPLASMIWPLMLPVELAPPPWANAGSAVHQEQRRGEDGKSPPLHLSLPDLWCSDCE